MQIMKPDQNLLGHLPTNWQGNSIIIIPLNNLQKVDPKDLKNHHKMVPVNCLINKSVQKLHHMTIVPRKLNFFIFVKFDQIVQKTLITKTSRSLLQNLNLVKSGRDVVLGRLLNLKGNITIQLDIPGQPNSRKMTKTQFLQNDVSFVNNLSDIDCMVSSLFIVVQALVL